jgi:CDP-paratose synthetase
LNDPLWKSKVAKEKPEIIIHLAAYLTSADDENAIDKLISANINFGTHLLDALKETKPALFINTGTFAEYSGQEIKLNPAYLYAATKTAFRPILNYFQKIIGFKLLHVIPYTIYGVKGETKKLIDFIYDSLEVSTLINMSPGDQVLDFIHISDVISFYKKLIDNYMKIDIEENIFHLGTGIGTTPRQLAVLIESIFEKKVNINWGGKPYRVLDTMYAVAPHEPLSDRIGWKPIINLKEGINLEYLKRHRGV